MSIRPAVAHHLWPCLDYTTCCFVISKLPCKTGRHPESANLCMLLYYCVSASTSCSVRKWRADEEVSCSDDRGMPVLCEYQIRFKRNVFNSTQLLFASMTDYKHKNSRASDGSCQRGLSLCMLCETYFRTLGYTCISNSRQCKEAGLP